MQTAIRIFILGVALFIYQVDGHARFIEPPSRASLWRFKNTDDMIKPYKDIVMADYNDNSLFCGGREGFIQNGEKCAICGDAYNAAVKPHEDPQQYAKGIIVRNYKQGDLIDVTIQVTAKHEGDFEFKLCPLDNLDGPPTQDCFDQFPLQFGDGTYKYGPISKNGDHFMKVKLPTDVVCEKCILQWKWRTANSWGTDANGSGIGFGPQETYQGCADVSITSGTPGVVTTTKTTSKATTVSTTTAAVVRNCNQEICGGNNGFRFENIRNKSQYYECINGKLVLQNCEPGTRYKRNARACK